MAKSKTPAKKSKTKTAAKPAKKSAVAKPAKTSAAKRVAAKPAAEKSAVAKPAKTSAAKRVAATPAAAKPAAAKPAAKPAEKPAAKPAAAKSATNAADALWEQYCEKPERELLRVYADALAQAGNPRGTFINLCLLDDPTPEQLAAKETLMSKQKKVLAGPAGEFLREFDFDRNGLVGRARIEFDKIAKNPAAFRTLNPHLVLTITSVKTLDDAQLLGQTDLGPIWFVDFGWITGTHGGMNLDDKKLARVAPAFKNVRHLQLSLRGTPAKCFSPQGARVIGQYATALRYLALDLYPEGMPPAAEYAARIGDANFGALRAFDIEGLTEFPGRPHVKVGTGLVADGRFSDETEQQLESGRSIADLLEAAIG